MAAAFCDIQNASILSCSFEIHLTCRVRKKVEAEMKNYLTVVGGGWTEHINGDFYVDLRTIF